jgi:transposase
VIALRWNGLCLSQPQRQPDQVAGLGWNRGLHQGRFTWPRSTDAVCTLSAAEWQWLVQGVDWCRPQAKPQDAWQV